MSPRVTRVKPPCNCVSAPPRYPPGVRHAPSVGAPPAAACHSGSRTMGRRRRLEIEPRARGPPSPNEVRRSKQGPRSAALVCQPSRSAIFFLTHVRRMAALAAACRVCALLLSATVRRASCGVRGPSSKDRRGSQPMTKEYGPSVPLCRLYERISKNGNIYLTGRLGAAKLAVLKLSPSPTPACRSRNVLVSEAPARPKDTPGVRTIRTEPYEPQPPAEAKRSATAGRGMPDEEIPFLEDARDHGKI